MCIFMQMWIQMHQELNIPCLNVFWGLLGLLTDRIAVERQEIERQREGGGIESGLPRIISSAYGVPALPTGMNNVPSLCLLMVTDLWVQTGGTPSS